MNARNAPAPGGPAPGRHPDLDRVLAPLPADEAGRLREVWMLSASAAPEDVLDPEAAARTERALDALAASGTAAAPSRNGSSQDSPPRRADRAALPSARRSAAPRRTAGWAASLVVLTAVAAFVWARQPVVVEAPVGERVTVQLPDGSTATLNSGSTLRRARAFGLPFVATREVRLEGEAFFDVLTAEPPFVVSTSDAVVTVLGTRFGVRAWPEDGESATTVALLSGRVRLTPTADPGAAVVLTPGEVGRVTPTSRPVVEGGGVEEALAWQAGDLVYKDRPLGVILADVERRFGVAVSPSPASLALRRVSVALRGPASVEAVVQDLATALGLRYRRTAEGFELYGAGAAGAAPHSLSSPP